MNNVYNHVYSLKQGLDGEEAKFAAFNQLGFDRVCIGLKKHGAATKFLQLPRSEASMRNLMSQNTFKSKLN